MPTLPWLKRFWNLPLIAALTTPRVARTAALNHLRTRFFWWFTSGVAGLAVLLMTAPGQALQARLSPASPQLGDTIVVQVNGDSGRPPSVTLGSNSYPAFALSNDRYRAFIPTTPLDRPGNLRLKVAQGNQFQELTLKLRNRSFPTQSIWLSPGKGDDGTDYEFDRVDAFKKLVTSEKYWKGPLLRPNEGEITAGYGIRRYYNGEFAKDYYHRGVDYAGDEGSPVIAPAAGRVVLVGLESKGFQIHGNTVGLDHGQGVASIFLHLSQINVKEGDFVRAGQVVGAVGSTGAATGPHLHWGLYVNGKSVDPVPWRTKGFE